MLKNFSIHIQITVASSPTQESYPVPLFANQGTPTLAAEEMLLTPVMISGWDMFAPSLQDDQADYSKETGDMDVAEDIIFRPLFKYRQESQQRSKYYDESNRRYSNYYPRRASFYRPRYDNY